MPLWVMVELMSFSDISKLYCAMYYSEKKTISDAVGVSMQTLENHLHCLSVLRNKCAHAVRLYNTEFNPPAHFTTTFLKKNPEVKNNSLFTYSLVLLKRLLDSGSKKNFVDALNVVIDQYNGDINMSLIGFPPKYKQILLNNL